MAIRIVALSGLILTLTGCDIFAEEDPICEEKKAEVFAMWGEPEETSIYDSGDYASEDWWYWSRGVEFTFTWGNYTTGCDFSVYEFSPI